MQHFRARRQKSGTTYYYFDAGGKPRKEIPLGKDYVAAVRKWTQLMAEAAPVVAAHQADQGRPGLGWLTFGLPCDAKVVADFNGGPRVAHQPTSIVWELVPVLGLKAAHDGTFYGIVVVAQRGNLENRHCVLILACAITKDGEAQQWRAACWHASRYQTNSCKRFMAKGLQRISL